MRSEYFLSLAYAHQYPSTNTSTNDIFFFWWDYDEFKENAIYHIIHYFFTVAKVDEVFRRVLLDAGILHLLLRLLQQEFGNYPLPSRLDGDISTIQIETSDMILLDAIRHQANYRGSVLSRTFDVFLRPFSDADEALPEFRSIDSKS